MERMLTMPRSVRNAARFLALALAAAVLVVGVSALYAGRPDVMVLVAPSFALLVPAALASALVVEMIVARTRRPSRWALAIITTATCILVTFLFATMWDEPSRAGTELTGTLVVAGVLGMTYGRAAIVSR